MKIDFNFSNAPAKREISELTIARANVITTTEQNTRSVSSYFKEFRRNHGEVKAYLEAANKRGRKFNEELVSAIIGAGEIRHIIESDLVLQARLKTPARVWSAARLMRAFVEAVEIKTPAKK